MKNKWITISIVSIGFLLLSCGGGDTGNSETPGYENEFYKDYLEGEMEEMNSDDATWEEESNQNSQIVETEVIFKRKLIKTGFIEFEFEEEDFSSMKEKISKSVDKYDAYVSSEYEYSSYQRVNATVEIRVPSKHFESLLKDITSGVKNYDRKEISAQDVTEEFIDIEARISTKKELEQRYIDLLDKAVTVNEILSIEHEIGLLRTEIESYEGRLKYLTSSVAFSTLSITYYKIDPEQNRFAREFDNGFNNGWDNLVWFFVGLTHVWPFIILVLLAIIGFRIKRRKKKLNKSINK